jgi:hypothetical protein
MQAAFAAFDIFEMLHRVRDVHAVSVQSRRLDGLVEEASGWTDERQSAPVLNIARLFAHQHDARIDRSGAEHSLCAHLVERATLAAARISRHIPQFSIGFSEDSGHAARST